MESSKEMVTMDCEVALEILSASLDGEAGLEELDLAAAHLAICEQCQRAERAMEEDDLLLRAAGRPDSGAREQPGQLVRGAFPAVEIEEHRRPGRVWLAGLAAAATVALCLWAVGWLDRMRPASPHAEQEQQAARAAGTVDRAPGLVPGRDAVVGPVEQHGERGLEQQLDALSERASLLVAQSMEGAERTATRRGNPFRPRARSNPFAAGVSSGGAASPFRAKRSWRRQDLSSGKVRRGEANRRPNSQLDLST